MNEQIEDGGIKLIRRAIENGLVRHSIPKTEEVERRIETELAFFEENKLIDVIILLSDLSVWAKANYINVCIKISRASCSLVLFLLDLALINPIQYRLYFELFDKFVSVGINVESGIKYRVVEYLRKKYGENRIRSVRGDLVFGEKPDEIWIGISNGGIASKIADCLTLIRERYGILDVFDKDESDARIYEFIRLANVGYIFGNFGLGNWERLKKVIRKNPPKRLVDIAKILIIYAVVEDFSKFINAQRDMNVGEILMPYLFETGGLLIWNEQLYDIIYGLSEGNSIEAIYTYKRNKINTSAEIRPDFIEIFARRIRPKYGDEVATNLCEKLYRCGQETWSKEHALVTAKQIYRLAYLKVHFRPEYDDIFNEETDI